MINFANLEQYRENNRIEAKKALGGLPHSIWETYSAFANALGGIILLGVEEQKDHSLHPVSLPEPDHMVKQFWNLLNDSKKVSANILNPSDVSVETVDGKHIIAIRVPRAHRTDKPIFVEGNPYTGSYRRNGEGDYRCTKEEVDAMLRDATLRSGDMEILPDLGVDALDFDTVEDYRRKGNDSNPHHPWLQLSQTEFLIETGAAQADGSGKLHPTVAGLLLLGKQAALRQVFPGFHPKLSSPYASASPHWKNLYRFYFGALDILSQSIPVTEAIGSSQQNEIYRALKEALVNCLLHADYHGECDVEIVCTPNGITFTNPGRFRIDIEIAKSGSISDSRNSALSKLFRFIGIGSGRGGGLADIFSVWNQMGWSAPSIAERFDPDRITLTLPFGKEGLLARHLSRNQPLGSLPLQRQAIVNHLTQHITITAGQVGELLGMPLPDADRLLRQMVADSILSIEDNDSALLYRLKA